MMLNKGWRDDGEKKNDAGQPGENQWGVSRHVIFIIAICLSLVTLFQFLLFFLLLLDPLFPVPCRF